MAKNNSQVIFGRRAIIETIEAGKEIDKILMQAGVGGELMDELWELIKTNRIRVQKVPIQKLNQITKKNHQGVVAFTIPIETHSLEQLIPFIFEKGETPLLLVLDGITDVRNFGAICRTAECAGVHGIVIPQQGSAQINEDAIKTSAGALQRIPICRVDKLKQAVQFIANSGIQLVACTEKTDHSVYDIDFNTPVAIIIGSEDLGISQDILNLSEFQAKIPLLGEIASLNVSVATGVILYEALRQRKG